MCEDVSRHASSVAFDQHYGADELDKALTHDLETLAQASKGGKAEIGGMGIMRPMGPIGHDA